MVRHSGRLHPRVLHDPGSDERRRLAVGHDSGDRRLLHVQLLQIERPVWSVYRPVEQLLQSDSPLWSAYWPVGQLLQSEIS